MRLTDGERDAKLLRLCEIEGFCSVDALLAACMLDAVSPAICAAPDCSYTCETEPDQRGGWCELCRRNTVVAALVLARLI